MTCEYVSAVPKKGSAAEFEINVHVSQMNKTKKHHQKNPLC